MSTKPRVITLPNLPRGVVMHDRHAMKKGHPTARFQMMAGERAMTALPIDWTKNGGLSFPMWWNNTLGDCMEEAGAHVIQAMTGCATGTEFKPDPAKLKAQYLSLSGGDNGLDEGTLIRGWKTGLAGDPKSAILDAVDIDPTNLETVAQAMQLFGPQIFMLAVPDVWLNSANPGFTWDATQGAKADENNGHGVAWTGIDAQGDPKIETWGFDGHVTQAGIKICDPSAFAVFSLAWFNAQGVAPNGMNYDALAQAWLNYTGRHLPPNPFTNAPPVPPVPPTPPTPPTPAGSILTVTGTVKAGTYSLPGGTRFTLGAALGTGTYVVNKK